MTKTTGPIYQMIAGDLHQRIVQGEFESLGKLPTQKELAKKYEVAILTIKQALLELQKEGLISGIRGSGTFVRAESFSYRLRFLSSLDEEIHAQHRDLNTALIEIDHDVASNLEIRKLLHLKAEQEYGSIWRLRSIDGVPIILQQSIVSAEHYPMIEKENLPARSLYSMLEKNGNVRVISASESIRAIKLPKFVAKYLGKAANSIGMISTRISKDEANHPIILDYAYFPGDKVVIESDRILGAEVI